MLLFDQHPGLIGTQEASDPGANGSYSNYMGKNPWAVLFRIRQEILMAIRGASNRILDQLRAWEGLETHPHRFGGIEFGTGKRAIELLRRSYVIALGQRRRRTTEQKNADPPSK